MRQSTRLSRRRFLRRAAGAGAVVACPTVVRAAALGLGGRTPPSGRIVMGVVGTGRRGTGDMRTFLGFGEIQVVAVCDVVRDHRDKAKALVDAHYGSADCASTVDYREITRRDDVDVVLIGTPDHWHAIPSIDACRHGKDVFCEKPLSLTIAEGRAMADAARTYDRVFSSGSQRVLGDHGNLCRAVRGGAIGRPLEAWVDIGGPSRPCDLGGQPVPDGMDWDRWLGPAPWAPYHLHRCSRAYGLEGKGWRTWQDYSGGMMTDWGGHRFGAALFALGLDHTGPTEIYPPDGKDHRLLTYVFANGVRLYHAPGRGPGVQIRGTEATAPGDKVAVRGRVDMPTYKGTGGLGGDFVHSILHRERAFRDVERAHRTATVCHLGNIAYKLKRPLKWDPVRERFTGDDEANRMIDRPKREPYVL